MVLAKKQPADLPGFFIRYEAGAHGIAAPNNEPGRIFRRVHANDFQWGSTSGLRAGGGGGGVGGGRPFSSC